MFDKPYDPKEVESKIYKKWLDSGYFNPDKLPKTYHINFRVFFKFFLFFFYSFFSFPVNGTGSLLNSRKFFLKSIKFVP